MSDLPEYFRNLEQAPVPPGVSHFDPGHAVRRSWIANLAAIAVMGLLLTSLGQLATWAPVEVTAARTLDAHARANPDVIAVAQR